MENLPLNVPLILGLGAVAMVGYWMVKKAFKLALFAAIAGAALWYWYFEIN